MSCGCRTSPTRVCPLPARHGRRVTHRKQAISAMTAARWVLTLGHLRGVKLKDVPSQAWRFNARGRVKWAGVWWVGVPYPVRWWLWLWLDCWPDLFEGCGCIVPAKALWLNVWRRVI